MDSITSKEKILKKVRQALNFKQKNPYLHIDLETNVYAPLPLNESLSETFARSFTKQHGQFVACENTFDCIDKLITLIDLKKWKYIFCWEEELQNQLQDVGISFIKQSNNIDRMQISITSCEAIVARTGSVLLSSTKNSRILSIWPSVHIVVGYKSQIVAEIKDSYTIIKNKYGKNSPSTLSYITGPSRTSDIPNDRPIEENIVVVGAQGPKELFVFLIDDNHK